MNNRSTPSPDGQADAFPVPANANGFTKLPHAILYDPRLSGHDLLLLIAIRAHAWTEGAECWPSNARLAKLARISVASVKRTMVRLESFGLLRREPDTSGTRPNATKRRISVGETPDRSKILSGPTTKDSRTDWLTVSHPTGSVCASGTGSVCATEKTYFPEGDIIKKDTIHSVSDRLTEVASVSLSESEKLTNPEAGPEPQSRILDHEVDDEVSRRLRRLSASATSEDIHGVACLMARGLASPRAIPQIWKMLKEHPAEAVADAYHRTRERIIRADDALASPIAYLRVCMGVDIASAAKRSKLEERVEHLLAQAVAETTPIDPPTPKPPASPPAPVKTPEERDAVKPVAQEPAPTPPRPPRPPRAASKAVNPPATTPQPTPEAIAQAAAEKEAARLERIAANRAKSEAHRASIEAQQSATA